MSLWAGTTVELSSFSSTACTVSRSKHEMAIQCNSQMLASSSDTKCGFEMKRSPAFKWAFKNVFSQRIVHHFIFEFCRYMKKIHAFDVADDSLMDAATCRLGVTS